MNALSKLTDWLEKEPNQTEVIIIRRRSNQFCVKIEYGNSTTVPAESMNLEEAIMTAVDQANRLPSAKRKDAEKPEPKVKPMVTGGMMPGMTSMPGL